MAGVAAAAQEKRTALAAAVVALGCFAALALAVKLGSHELRRFDHAVLDYLLSHDQSRPLRFATRLSHYFAGWKGTVLVTTLLCLGVAAAGRFAALVFIVAAVAFLPLTEPLKEAFRRSPPATLRMDEYSFPSGHALGSMTLSLTVLLLTPRGPWRGLVGFLGGLYVCAIGAAVVVEEGHWPSDVLASWALATAWVATLVTTRAVYRAR